MVQVDIDRAETVAHEMADNVIGLPVGALPAAVVSGAVARIVVPTLGASDSGPLK